MTYFTHNAHVRYAISSLSLFLILLFCTFSLFAYEIQVQVEENAAATDDRLSVVAYGIKESDCTVWWKAIQFKSDKRPQLQVTRQCNKTFKEQAGYHEAIIERINKDVPIARFESLSWGSFTYKDDDSWTMPIALASDNSRTYFDYRQNYPHARVNDINQIFVELANQTQVYQPLAELFADYKMTIVLQSVEKVFTSRADKLPFYDDLRQQDVGQHARVIYDAGMSDFVFIARQ